MSKYKFTNPHGHVHPKQNVVPMDLDDTMHNAEDAEVIRPSDNIMHNVEDVEVIELSNDTTHIVEGLEVIGLPWDTPSESSELLGSRDRMSPNEETNIRALVITASRGTMED